MDFGNYISHLKEIIILQIVEKRNYENIINKVLFYYKDEHNNIPREDCLSFLYRKLYTKSPKPYHYDYKTSNSLISDFDEATFLLRKKFGYANRILSDSNTFNSNKIKSVSTNSSGGISIIDKTYSIKNSSNKNIK